jgi:hypothetical protein
MFEEGIVMKKQFGPENVYDLSLGNPVMEPPPEFKRELKRLANGLEPARLFFLDDESIKAKVSNSRSTDIVSILSPLNNGKPIPPNSNSSCICIIVSNAHKSSGFPMPEAATRGTEVCRPSCPAPESRGHDPLQETPAARRVSQSLLILNRRFGKSFPHGPGKEPAAPRLRGRPEDRRIPDSTARRPALEDEAVNRRERSQEPATERIHLPGQPATGRGLHQPESPLV